MIEMKFPRDETIEAIKNTLLSSDWWVNGDGDLVVNDIEERAKLILEFTLNSYITEFFASQIDAGCEEERLDSISAEQIYAWVEAELSELS